MDKKKKYRLWSEADDKKLEKLWGKENVEDIARKLKRTVGAVLMRVTRKGLGSRLERIDGVAIYTFLQVLLNRKSGLNEREVKKYIKSGAPWFSYYVDGKEHKLVKIDKFWEWAKNNPDVYDLSRIEPLMFGKEPDWMRDYRKRKSLEKAAKRWECVA